MRHVEPLVFPLTLALCACVGVSGDRGTPNASPVQPSYTEDGELRRPRGIDTWVFVGASVGLEYSGDGADNGPGKIQAVHMEPFAYAHYARTGEFPERTLFSLTVYEPSQRDLLAGRGFYAGDLRAIEVAVKDSERFEEGWAYFDFGVGDVPAAAPFPKASCHDCHAEHAAHDNVFVQFYPVLRGLRERVTGP